MVTGWRRKRRDSATIGSGMVAEKSIVWRSLGQHRQDLLDVLEEAQVEHPVGLVEHQGLDRAELELLLLGQVEQAAGRADQDLDALLQGSTCGSYATPP
jgi:hypothetical protein